jgi:hypothetical protein
MSENPYEAPQQASAEPETDEERKLRDEQARESAKRVVVLLAIGCSALAFIGLARYLVLFLNG